MLIVCTGNICRSPAAERLLAARLAGTGVTVASAGTRARTGALVDAPMAELLRAVDVTVAGFAARELRVEHVEQADLVLAMTRAHRTAAVAMVPAAVRRAFLLAEAAEIAEAIAVAGWPEWVGRSAAARLTALPTIAPRFRSAALRGADEVPDPYRRAHEEYRESFSRIESAVDRLVRALS